MLSFFKKLLRSRGRRYELQKRKLLRGTPSDLMALAKDDDTNPEILYYLAQKGDAGVRLAVAHNAATPGQAAVLLAQDNSVDVRLALADRLLRLVPDLSPERQGQLYAYAVQVLGVLAQDEMLQVRRALTSVLRDVAKAPPAVVSRLARDVEREVSEPILRFCVALADEDMLDILRGHPASWVVTAIAERPAVSPAVSDAVYETGDVPATTALLNNKGAALSVETLQKIVDNARAHPEWHHGMALRPELSIDLARQMTGFVDQLVLDVLEKRSDFDAATRQNLVAIIRRRLDYAQDGGPDENAAAKVARYVRQERLTPDVISDALAWYDTEFVEMALAVLSGVHPSIVRRVVESKSPKSVVALCWKSGLPMRLCIEVQKLLARIQPQEILYARGGTDYPLSAEEMEWQLEFFGVGK